MSEKNQFYTTQLSTGLGLVDETKLLLSIFEPGMTSIGLYEKALQSGLFPMVSARRLKNIVNECFSPRYIKSEGATFLKPLLKSLSSNELVQLFLIYSAQSNIMLHDFIKEIFWKRYSSGYDTLSADDAKDFIHSAKMNGKLKLPWSDTTIKRQSSYLVGICADYGLLSAGRGSKRTIQPVRIQESTVLYLAYKLHFDGLGDNAVINHKAWSLFGLEGSDVRQELKRLAKNGWLIIQSAGDVTRIAWQLKSMQEVVDVITQS